jgi:hypothetical protein
MAAKDHVAVRLDPPTLERLELVREVLSTEWHQATQSDVLRAVILSGLKLLEKEHAAKIAETKKRREASREAPPEKGGSPSSRRAKKTKG